MFIYLNTQQVIIDIVEDFKPIRKNENDIFVPCDFSKAQAVIGSDDAIYAKAGVNIVPSFYDVYSVVSVDIPEGVTKLEWMYSDGQFVKNENPYPVTNLDLAIEDIALEDAVCELSESTDTSVAALEQALCDLSEEIGGQ